MKVFCFLLKFKLKKKICCEPGQRASGGVEELIEPHSSGAVLNVDITHGRKRGPISPAASSVHTIKHLIVNWFQSHRLQPGSGSQMVTLPEVHF